MLVAIIALLVATIAVSSFLVKIGNFQPFSPHGLLPIGSSSPLIFWSFLGYENVSNVASEFENPARDFRKSVVLSATLVSALYVSVSFVTIGNNV